MSLFGNTDREGVARLAQLLRDKGYEARGCEVDGLHIVEVEGPDFYESDIDPRSLMSFAWEIENYILDNVPDVDPELMTFSGHFDIETCGSRDQPSYATVQIFVSNLEKFWGCS